MLNRFVGLCLAAVVSLADAQQTGDIVVRSSGSGRPGRMLREIVATPHVSIRAAERGKAVIPSDSVVPTSLIAIGVHVAVEGRVEGDLVVVNGDLFMRPGGHVTGRALAVGGGVYASSLGRIDGESQAFPDAEFDVTAREGVLYLDYRGIAEDVPVVTLPLLYGLRTPTYTRVDGLAIPFGPRFTLARERVVIDPLVTYRSDLGEWDPSLTLRLPVGRQQRLELWAGRGTFTNDTWIQRDLLNSITTLVGGSDRRNYFRAERAEALLRRSWQLYASEYELSVGGRGEFAYSVNAGGPWSLLDENDDVDGMLRPNPSVRRGRIYSALLGASGMWELVPDVSGRIAAGLEHALRAPGDANFTQLTVNGVLTFPTFRDHSFDVEAHAVATLGDEAPPQRFSYVGGAGTLPTFDLLRFGGDQLLYFDGRYNVPISRLQLPVVGPPVVSLRYMIGSAGIGTLPEFEQNLALRLGLGYLRVEFGVDPNTGDTQLDFGISMR